MDVAKEEIVKTEELETRYERYKGILKDLTIMSDVFMRNVFKKRECTEYVLQVIMNKKDLKVIDQVLQKDYKNLQGRSAILDCVARDSEGKQMDVEIQQDNEGASPKRARYHSGLMDMNTLNPGQDFDDLPESYVIFITRDDALGYGLPIYHIDRKIEEVSENFKDEAHIIYVNSKKQEDTELGRLMHDLHCKNAEDMHSKILADRVYELKETQKGVEFMCREMEQIYSEGRSNVVTGVMSFAEMDAMMYKIEGEDLYLIGTSEHSMIGKFIDTIVDEKELPKTLTSYSPCFRKEKGAHGIEERGVYRIHQFEKQEMIVVCKPEESKMWFDKLWQNTVDLFRSLDIPVRTLECCSGDLADLKVKSIDVEAWSPRQKKYFEVGSCSNLGDAQARRLQIRVRGENGEKYFAHTLNNTVVAPPRMLIAFLENNLQADGNVRIPEALRPYMGGKEFLGK